MTAQDDKKKEAKGFAGLSDLVPDIDASPPPVEADSAKEARPSAAPASKAAPAEAKPQTPPAREKPTPPGPPDSSSGGKWVIGIIVVLGVFWLIGQADKRPTNSTGRTSGSQVNPGSSYQAPSRPEEVRPPVGQDLVLSAAQIRYCLAEDIRMDGAKSSLNNYSDADVDRFNAMVSDYNSRCGSFRYRRGALEGARRDIEPFRSQLQSEGAHRFVDRDSSTLRNSAAVRAAPDATVQLAQRKLNELGYEAGPVDGLMGRATRLAISAFQRDAGVTVDGVADQELIRLLDQTARDGVRARVDSPNNRTNPSPSPQVNITPTRDEQASLELACIVAKSRGPAAYNNCLSTHLTELASSPRSPNMAALSYDERSAIELACIVRKSDGPAKYNRCLVSQVHELERAPRQPDLSGLSYDERSAIELACITRKSDGAASYNRCLIAQLNELQAAPRMPSLEGLDYQTKSSIQLACITSKSSGAAAYSRCLTAQLRSIGR